MAAKILAFILALVTLIVVTTWLDDFLFWIVAFIGGLAAAVVVYGLMVNLIGSAYKQS